MKNLLFQKVTEKEELSNNDINKKTPNLIRCLEEENRHYK